jgi:hypothetical protein
VLYGVGARLDERPEVLFRLRAVNEKDLVADLDTALSISSQPLDIGKVLETDDISALFGLDMAGTGGAIPGHGARPAAPEPVAPAAPKANPRATSPTRQISETGKTDKAPHSAEPIAQARPLDDSMIQRASRRVRDPRAVKRKDKRTMPKPEIELTPDGFVKWWK